MQHPHIANASDEFNTFAHAAASFAIAHGLSWCWVNQDGDIAAGLKIIGPGAWQANTYADFIAVLQLLPSTLPDGKLEISLNPTAKLVDLWHD